MWATHTMSETCFMAFCQIPCCRIAGFSETLKSPEKVKQATWQCSAKLISEGKYWKITPMAVWQLQTIERVRQMVRFICCLTYQFNKTIPNAHRVQSATNNEKAGMRIHKMQYRTNTISMSNSRVWPCHLSHLIFHHCSAFSHFQTFLKPFLHLNILPDPWLPLPMGVKSCADCLTRKHIWPHYFHAHCCGFIHHTASSLSSYIPQQFMENNMARTMSYSSLYIEYLTMSDTLQA